MSIGLRAQANRLQPTPTSIAPQDIIQRGLDAEKELYGGAGPAMQDIPEDMQLIDGVTDKIRDQWMKLNNFAQTMWANYKIDVTKPDARNPLAIRANQQYQKALAGLGYAGDVLKQSNKLLALDRTAEREGKGVVMANPQEDVYGMVPEGDRFVNTEVDPMALQSNYAYAKMTNDPNARRTMQANVDQNRAAAEGIYQGLGRDKRAQIVGEQFQGPTFQRDVRLDPDYPRRKQEADNARIMFNEVENLRTGLYNEDPNAISRLKGVAGIVDVRPVRTGDKKGVYVTYKDGNDRKTEFVSFRAGDSQYGGRSQLNDILQRLNPSRDKVPSSIMLPYFDEASRADTYEESDEMSVYFNKAKTVLGKLGEKGDSKLDDGTFVTKQQKEDLVNDLDALAVQGVLRAPNGSQIYDITWKGKKLILSTDDSDEDIEIDPSQAKWRAYLNKLLEFNSYHLFPSELHDRDDYQPLKAVGTVGKDRNLKLDKNATGTIDAKSIVDEWEKSKPIK